MSQRVQSDEIAAQIAETNCYLIVATLDTGFSPWAAPVAYWTDQINCFYFVSHKDSKHIQNIRADPFLNPSVAFVIFDSSVPEGQWDKSGLQFSATAIILSERDLLSAALGLRQKFSSGRSLEDVMDKCFEWYKNGQVIVRMTPKKIWLNCSTGQKDTRTIVHFNRPLRPSPVRSHL